MSLRPGPSRDNMFCDKQHHQYPQIDLQPGMFDSSRVETRSTIWVRSFPQPPLHQISAEGLSKQFRVISICTQTSILFLTIAKQLFASHLGVGRTPIVSLMIRDGLLAFFVIFGLHASRIAVLGGTLACMTTANGLAFVQSWLVSNMSCIGCRLIINMQHLSPADEDSQEFTELDMDEAALNTQFTISLPGRSPGFSVVSLLRSI
ncbi:hypothetical protein HWV62_749 [Athelia sp. TMB]|nr:hypothetical protein HWV62_749 [Athelia sp. TMB]